MLANSDKTRPPTYNRRSKHDPKSPKEHEDAMGLCQSVQANNLSGNVGGERPVSREETQDGRQDLQSHISLSHRDKEQRNAFSEHGESIQIDAVYPPDVHHDTQH